MLIDNEFLFSCTTLYLTRSLRSLVRYQVENSKRSSISSRTRVLSSMCDLWNTVKLSAPRKLQSRFQRPRSFLLAVTFSRNVQKPFLNLKSAFVNVDSFFVSFFLGCFHPIHGGVVSGYDSKPWHSYYYSLCGYISFTPVPSLRSFVLYRQREYS